MLIQFGILPQLAYLDQLKLIIFALGLPAKREDRNLRLNPSKKRGVHARSWRANRDVNCQRQALASRVKFEGALAGWPLINIEALYVAPLEALAHSPSQMPLSCPVAPPSQRELHKDGGGGGGVARRARAARAPNAKSCATSSATSCKTSCAAAHADPQGHGKLRLDAWGRLRGKGVDELRGALRFRAGE